MIKKISRASRVSSYLIGLSLAALCASHAAAQTGAQSNPRGRLLKSVSNKDMVETARRHQWSINFPVSNRNDTVHVVALRVDFMPDRSSLTTGNGKFGGTAGDKEDSYYWKDTVYRYDKMAHDSAYFAYQLTGVKNYYHKVSRGKLTVDFSIYPGGRQGDNGQIGYTVPDSMPSYSPGWKKKTETTDQYWDRKTYGLMKFIKDAIETAGNSGAHSPFANLYADGGGALRFRRGAEEAASDPKAAVLIFHAGASYLTDGGLQGAAAADSPSDMIDAFIDREFFKHFKDTLKLDTAGIRVTGAGGKQLTVDEVMMCAETSNQDGLNWGIQGVLVNQMARQLGIPDLFSTSSGVSAVGAFCIMDFAGYSAGQGFIPPYPSAWVRAFMGWDTPRVAGAGSSYSVKALTSVLDAGNAGAAQSGDTTILLIPINTNEYYLVENRQRNLTGDPTMFRYDLQDVTGVINPYPFNVNIPKNVESACGTGRNVILEAKNNDVSLPASGVLVWHVDERIIRQRLAYNFVNADSSYRGVRLVEADGVNDLGVTFVDAFYQAAFDYGGAEDVFPHETRRGNTSSVISQVNWFGPYTSPSTRANDGGHTYLNIKIHETGSGPKRTELSHNFQGNTVVNFSSDIFTVTVDRDYAAPGWPRRAAPENMFYDPLVTEIAAPSASSESKDTVLALLSGAGRLYMYPVNRDIKESYGTKTASIELLDYHGKKVESSIKVKYLDSIPGAFTFPTAIDGRVYIPSSHGNRHVINVYNSTDINDKTIIDLPAKPASYVSGVTQNVGSVTLTEPGPGGVGGFPLIRNSWAVGLSDGSVATGWINRDVNNEAPAIIKLASNSPVSAIAALKDAEYGFAVIQNDGTLSVIRSIYYNVKSKHVIRTGGDHGIPPFKLVTGDLDNDGRSEIIVSDSRQGVWVFTRGLDLAQGWRAAPNDWANTYHIDPNPKAGKNNRSRYPVNLAAPALADLNRDGALDIIVSGTNGIYALNRKGALLSKWPAYLDNRYWYQRGSVTTPPIVAADNGDKPLVLFSSPTGERSTFTVTKIITADKARGVVTFRRDNGTLDSLWDLSAATIDTILTIGDSLILPYILPGGFIDALGANAARPMEQIPGRAVQQSRWPLTVGSPAASPPVIYRKANDRTPDLFAVSSDGMVYKWRLSGMVTDSLYWPQTGFDAARSFAYGGTVTKPENIEKETQPITLWNYPNPTLKDMPETTFKYKFSGQATNVRLDIYTITGRKMDSFTMKQGLTGDHPDWNEFKVNLRRYGPGIYRCRMGATINGKKHAKLWKMAVVK